MRINASMLLAKLFVFTAAVGADDSCTLLSSASLSSFHDVGFNSISDRIGGNGWDDDDGCAMDPGMSIVIFIGFL